MGNWTSAELNIVNFEQGQEEELSFVKMIEKEARDGKVYQVMEVINAEGITEHYFTSGHLRYLLKENEVTVGDNIKVVFVGKVEAEIKDEKGKIIKTDVNKYTLEKWVD